MSKEQTPITAEEWYNKNHKNLLAVKNTKGKLQYPFVSQNAHNLVEEHIYKIMEQYAKYREKKAVLEALEDKSKTAESILETLNDMHSNDEISYGRYTYLFDKVASIQLNETEVKPKYE